MQVISIEDVPVELSEYAKKRTYLVSVQDLDKRVRTLKQVFEAPKTNLEYARQMADRLWAKCVSAGRGDLAAEVMYIMFDGTYEKRRASNKQAAEAAKRRLQQCLDQ